MGYTIRFFSDLVLIGTVEVKPNQAPIISEHLPALIGREGIDMAIKHAQRGDMSGTGNGFTWQVQKDEIGGHHATRRNHALQT